MRELEDVVEKLAKLEVEQRHMAEALAELVKMVKEMGVRLGGIEERQKEKEILVRVWIGVLSGLGAVVAWASDVFGRVGGWLAGGK